MIIGPIPFGDKYGYIDERGNVCVPFEFGDIGSFSEGLAWFVKEGKVGFITETSKIVIPPTYDQGRRLVVNSDFHSGLAVVCLGGREGYIDTLGALRIPCRFKYCSRFVGEIAVVSEDAGGYSVIDREGQRVCLLPVSDVAEAPYEPDLIKVYPRIGWVSAPAFLNRRGSLVAGPFTQFEEVFCFGESSPSYACARFRSNGLLGFLDRQWRTVIDPTFSSALDFSEGVAGVATREHLWGYINARGQWVIRPEYTEVRPFHSGTALVCKGRRSLKQWFVVDKNNQVLSRHYDEVRDLGHGFRWVLVGKVLMVIDPGLRLIWSTDNRSRQT